MHCKARRRRHLFLASGLLVVASCGPRNESGRDTGATVGEQSAGLSAVQGLGAACQSSANCSSKEVCSAGACLCRAGLSACGHACFDLSSNPEHCGGCTAACSPGETCAAGSCSGRALLAPSTPSVDPPEEIDGTPSATTCSEACEGFPERSLTYGTADLYLPEHIAALSGLQCPPLPYNWASTPTSWNGSHDLAGQPCPSATHSDSWTTTSGYTGLEYVSQLYTDPNANWCVGIAASTATHLAENPPVWDYRLQCATPGGHADGPAMQFDQGGDNLFLVENENNGAGNPGNIVLDIFANCGPGHPGDPNGACPRTSTNICVDGACLGHAVIETHPGVAVNPCTHDAVVAYRNDHVDPNTGQWVGGTIFLKFYDANGTSRGTDSELTGLPLGDAAGCSGYAAQVPHCGGGSDCGGGLGGCMGTANKVQVVTHYDGSTGQCYAYATFDTTMTCSSGGTHTRAAIAVYNITNESAPSLVGGGFSSNCNNPTNNDFEGVPTADEFTNGVGFFFYRQVGGDPCDTIFTGITSTDLMLQNISSAGTIGGPFPTMMFDDSAGEGLGDYVGAVKRGLPSGYLYPTWSQPVTTTASCVSCQGVQKSLGIFGAEVLP